MRQRNNQFIKGQLLLRSNEIMLKLKPMETEHPKSIYKDNYFIHNLTKKEQYLTARNNIHQQKHLNWIIYVILNEKFQLSKLETLVPTLGAGKTTCWKKWNTDTEVLPSMMTAEDGCTRMILKQKHQVLATRRCKRFIQSTQKPTRSEVLGNSGCFVLFACWLSVGPRNAAFAY